MIGRLVGSAITIAISYAITICLVLALERCIVSAVRNSMAKKLEKKLIEMSIDINNPSKEDLKRLVDVQVRRVNGGYWIVYQDYIYGFKTEYIARNKKNALEMLSTKMNGYSYLYRDSLPKEEAMFYASASKELLTYRA